MDDEKFKGARVETKASLKVQRWCPVETMSHDPDGNSMVLQRV
jgi:hypothetical protein